MKGLSYSNTFCSPPCMKRDPDLIRDLMLALEAAEGAELLKLPKLDPYERHQVDHHFRLLLKGGFAAVGYSAPGGGRWVAVRLTWAGHDYLDKIRDPQLWRYTKLALTRAGIWSLETMGTIARTAVLAKLEAMGMGASA